MEAEIDSGWVIFEQDLAAVHREIGRKWNENCNFWAIKSLWRFILFYWRYITVDRKDILRKSYSKFIWPSLFTESHWFTDRTHGDESSGRCHYRKDNGITIIRDAAADWLLALAGVQSAPEDHSACSTSRHNASPAKNAARRIYFARRRLPDLSVYPFAELPTRVLQHARDHGIGEPGKETYN